MLHIDCVRRDTQASAPPVFTTVDPFVGATGVTFTHVLNGEGTAGLSVDPYRQPDTIRALLKDLDQQGVEAWYYLDGALVFAGPIIGYSIQRSGEGLTAQLMVRSAFNYLRRQWMGAGEVQTYTDEDQVTIAKTLIDNAQAKQYAHYGIDTSAMTPVGVTRDRTYDGNEGHNIAQRIQELAAVSNGFDFLVPANRQVRVGYPTLGVDRTDTVILDRRNIANPSARFLVGPEDFISHGFAVSPQSDGTYLTGVASEIARAQRWGRTSLHQSFQDVSRQDTIDDHAQRIVDQRGDTLYVPAPEVFPIDLDLLADIQIGDTVAVIYDYGFGLHEATRRVSRIMLSVRDDGGMTGRVTLV